MKKTLTMLACAALVAPAFAGEAITEPITLTMPATANNNGHGSTTAAAALLNYANNADGGYMFNNGGAVSTSTTTGEGILATVDGVTSVSLCPRAGAGGSGEAIVLAGTELAGKTVTDITLDITSSTGNSITGTVALTLAVIEKTNTTWSVLQSSTGSLTIGSGASLDLALTTPVDWDANHKIVAVIDNTGKTLSGNNGNIYTLSGIKVIVTPEPATATLSLLALAGLASRRRRH